MSAFHPRRVREKLVVAVGRFANRQLIEGTRDQQVTHHPEELFGSLIGR